jgi:hypothetical protein
MEFEYNRLDMCILFDNLKNEEIRKTLAYMVDFKEHENLIVIPKPYSIEISNADICIAIIVYVGFEREEYNTLKTKNNHHIVSFDRITQTMIEFKNMTIKHIDYMALFFMSLARTEDKKVQEFLSLKDLSRYDNVHQLRKK